MAMERHPAAMHLHRLLLPEPTPTPTQSMRRPRLRPQRQAHLRPRREAAQPPRGWRALEAEGQPLATEPLEMERPAAPRLRRLLPEPLPLLPLWEAGLVMNGRENSDGIGSKPRLARALGLISNLYCVFYDFPLQSCPLSFLERLWTNLRRLMGKSMRQIGSKMSCVWPVIYLLSAI